ncbi:MAG TPA: hypothetical protein VJN71_08525 [Nitrososphaerales archaeon]|nr:hypothetical protein [Nitrososphaerales archaeon]
MGFVAEALWLMKLRRYDQAARLLEKHLEDKDLKQSSKSSLMSWVGECYLQAEDRKKAGRWFELASKANSESMDLTGDERQSRILKDLELAMDCYRAEDDIAGIGRLASLRDTLMPRPVAAGTTLTL